jgi:hypothetical protein
LASQIGLIRLKIRSIHAPIAAIVIKIALISTQIETI